MITHDEIWSALDELAKLLSTSPSGLARNAGLDPTTFNRSKRHAPSGKERWPSTESLSKVLAVVGMSFEDFAALAASARRHGPAIPVIGLVQAGNEGFFDDAGFPVGAGWDEVRVPGRRDEHVFALEITGESMWPVYRPGDRVLVAPHATIRNGDRVVLKTRGGEVMAKELIRQTPTAIELRSVNPEFADRVFRPQDITWMARIIWASQ